jgi:tetratricopeptide (TPR) repeat protein
MLAKSVCCIALLSVQVWSQNAAVPAQELLEKAKQIYLQDGPKAALPRFEEVLKTFQAGGDRHGEAIALGYLANCYRKLEDLDKALDFGQRALRMKEELGDRDEVGKTHNQLGLILLLERLLVFALFIEH